MKSQDFIALNFDRYSSDEMHELSNAFYNKMKFRRSVRDFSSEHVAQDIIQNIIATAGLAPSGANKQPWSFCLVSNVELKVKIRQAAEQEEHENYHGRMSEEWLKDLKPLGTNWDKPFIDIAPWIIVMFKKPYDVVEGAKQKNYYVNESIGIAAGFLIAAIHQAGLVTLTHTPSPMNFLQRILGRPENERAYLLLPVGLPAPDAVVPDITKKPLEEILFYYD